MRTRVGYAGGTRPDPTYTHLGDHTETIEIDYDPSRAGYDEMLEMFFSEHDPRRVPLSRQYRSAIFYRTDEERAVAEAVKSRVEGLVGPVSTVIEPLERFYRAEDYHQKYYLRGRTRVFTEVRAQFADERAFVDSTAAARLNGWVTGCGSTVGLQRELPLVGLSERTADEIRALHARTR